MNMNKITSAINVVLAAAAAENQQEAQITQLHMAVEKTCVNLLIDATLGTIINKRAIEIPQKALELNLLKKEGCIDATIYLWEALYRNNDPMSKRERQRAEKAIHACLSRNNTININTIFYAISSVMV